MNITSFLSTEPEDRLCIASADTSWTYGQLHAWVKAACGVLTQAGVRPGSVIAHSFQDAMRSLVCQLAVARLGGTVVSIPLQTPALRRDELIALCRIRLLATDVDGLVYPGLRSIPIEFDCRADPPAPVDDVPEEKNPAAPWIIVSGSGSTGKPKLMAVTHAQQLARMRAGESWLPYGRDDRFASLIHLDFYATKQRCLEAFWKGASVYLRTDADQSLFELAKAGRVSVLYGTVFHFEKLLQAPEAARAGSLEDLRAVMVGGSIVSMALRARITERLCSRLHILYGANESHTACMAVPPAVFAHPGIVGRPHAGFALEVVDQADRPLPPGEVGHVRIKSEAMIDGYLDDARATAAAFRDGWFYPGDLGRLTQDGQLIHLGRADDLMIMNGINIYPLEIEHALTSHPQVEEACALPIKHAVHQDIPVCAVRLKPSANIDESSLQAYARERLGAHGPRRVFIADSFPRSEQSKVLREELAKTLGERLAAEARQRDDRLQARLQGLLHPVASFDVDLVLSGQVDLPALDAWLVQGMGIDQADLAPEPQQSGASGAAAARILLLRVLLLARAFLHLGKMPVFDLPTIRAMEANPRDARKFRATVGFASVGNIPPAVYQIAVKSALDLFQWMATHPITDANREALYATVQKKAVVPLTRLIPGGKSTLPVLRVAHAAGIPFIHLGLGVYQLGWGSRARRMDRSTVDLDTAIGSKLAQNKVAAASLVRMAGLPAPVHEVVGREAEAVAAAQRIGYPVVLKPSDRDRGEGVTVDVRDEAALLEAFRHAHKLAGNKQVIVERQVDGVCHRLFIARGKLLYAVKRLPMSVEGDGQRTVAQLVDDEVRRQNDAPLWKRSEIRPLDDMAIAAMRDLGLQPDSVPGKGLLVPLRRIESTEWGGVDEDVSARIHPDNLAVAIRAAELFGLHVAGIDIITPDISRPWHANGAIVNEVNFAPLFGGGEISRSRIPSFLSEFMQGDGKIPVDIFEGPDAVQRALAKQAERAAAGLRCYVTTAADTLDPRRQSLAMPLRTVEERVRALLCRPDVDALAIALAR